MKDATKEISSQFRTMKCMQVYMCVMGNVTTLHQVSMLCGIKI